MWAGLDGWGSGFLRGLCATGATADGQVQQTLHNGASGTAVGSLLTKPLNQCLLWFVDTSGDQVLGKARQGFLCGFFTTSLQGASRQNNTFGFDCIWQSTKDSERRKDFKGSGDRT